MVQTSAHAFLSKDSSQVSITSTGLDTKANGSAYGESVKQEKRYNPCQGIDGLEGCSIIGASTLQTENMVAP